ncbi:hypothetical protein C1I98_15135 [Spongiactinospora gelatinilytica]|uniref:Uncharacterized protein n=1 Tax=Spongiactinospora gelatinilytica TaxID=2666298 RepID=A0A2W2I5R5_9ACTN|nr:hypothetical protein C1I98_15135 [Spongiactinospora gelatinilytica]
MPLVAFLMTVAATAACQSDAHTDFARPTPISTQPPAYPSISPTPATDRDAVLAVYRELYRAGQRAEYATPAERRVILERVAAQPLLSTMLEGIAALRAKGRVTYGFPSIHSYGLRITGSRASLHDCQDGRTGGQADDRTGKRLTHGMPGTHMVAALSKEADGVWRVVKIDQLEEPCSPAT